ncbi:hypothetical protein KP509_12G022600 [Ceratopteris richardii]|nr:hypothetical protein KP509_12G022600 [Ceratopteris richardii]
MQENAQIRQDLDLKRRCALVYAFSQELNKCTEKQKSLSSLNFQPDRRNWIWVWLERWMATKYMGKTQHGVGKQQQSVISETQQRNKNASLCAKVLETDRSGSQLESAGDKHPVFIGPEIISEDVTGAAHQFEEGRFIIEDREIQCETEETKDVETICEVQDEVVEQAIKDKETTSIIVGGETTSRGVQKCAEEGNGVEDSCLVRNAETERGDVDFVLESSALGDDELEFSDDFVKKSVDAKLLPKQSSSSSPRSPVSTTTFQNAQATTPSPPVPPPSSSSSDWSSAAGPMLQNSELTIQAPLLSPPLIQSMEESESCTAERRKELSIINNNYPSTDVLDSASCLAERFSNANTPTVHTTLGTSAPSDFEDATSAFPCPITEQVNVFCPSGTLKNISDSPTAVNEISLGSSSIPEGDGNMHHKYANSTSMSDFRLQSSLPSHVSSPEVLPSAIQRHTLCTPLVIPNVTNEDMLDVAEEEMVDESHQQLTSMDSMLSVADGVVSCGADLYLDQSSVNADGGEIEELALRSDAPFNVLTANESVQNLSNSDQPDEGNDLRTDEASQDLSRSDDRINVLRTDRTVQNDPSTEVNGTSDTLGSSGNDHMKEMLTDNHLTSSPIMHGRQKEAVSPSIPNYMNTTQSSKAKMRSPSLKSEFPKLKSASPKPKFDLSKVKADSSHTKTDVTPKRRHDSPKQMLDSPKLRLESPKQRLDSPNRRLESPKQRLESPKQRFESPKQRLESPKQKHDYAKYKVDSDTTQKAETLVKRRHSFPGAEVKGSLGSNKPLMHVRATNKGNQSALLRGETGMEDLPRSNGHPRSRMEK